MLHAEGGHLVSEFTAEAVTAWAAVGALLFAGITTVIAVRTSRIALRQIREAREISRDADAQDSYRSYLEACLNNPELAFPDYKSIKSVPLKLEKYNWFVAYLLAASEKILEIAGDVPEWVDAIKLNVKYHKDLFLDRDNFEDKQLKCYDRDLRRQIFEVTGRKLPTDDFESSANDQSTTGSSNK